jgi:hypothetical protein
MQDLIRKHLQTLLSEEKVPGVAVTSKAQVASKGFNDEYQKDTKKKFDEYEGTSEEEDENAITPPKRELSDDEEDTRAYVEKRGGMNDLEYDGEVG